jgi:hypothetical protein
MEDATTASALLRQYLPKGTDLNTFTQDDLDAMADSPNARARRPFPSRSLCSNARLVPAAAALNSITQPCCIRD